jgi:hypothetical protein
MIDNRYIDHRSYGGQKRMARGERTRFTVPANFFTSTDQPFVLSRDLADAPPVLLSGWPDSTPGPVPFFWDGSRIGFVRYPSSLQVRVCCLARAGQAWVRLVFFRKHSGGLLHQRAPDRKASLFCFACRQIGFVFAFCEPPVDERVPGKRSPPGKFLLFPILSHLPGSGRGPFRVYGLPS